MSVEQWLFDDVVLNVFKDLQFVYSCMFCSEQCIKTWVGRRILEAFFVIFIEILFAS